MKALAVVLWAGLAAAAPDGAQVYWSADRLAAVRPYRIDFYLIPEGVGAYFVENGRLRPVPETFPARGELRFYETATVKAIGSHALFKLYEPGAKAKLEPAKSLTFAYPLTSPPMQRARRDSFLICTDPWLGKKEPKAEHESFCGALSLAGEMLISAPASAPGETLEPLGLSPRADEAFFAVGQLSGSRQPKRVVEEYLVWTTAGGFRRLPAHPMTPELRELLRCYLPEYYVPDPEPTPKERER